VVDAEAGGAGLESAVEEEPVEDGVAAMLMLLIVNFPDVLPLSPKRTRM
jgi:hypothetical protein